MDGSKMSGSNSVPFRNILEILKIRNFTAFRITGGHVVNDMTIRTHSWVALYHNSYCPLPAKSPMVHSQLYFVVAHHLIGFHRVLRFNRYLLFNSPVGVHDHILMKIQGGFLSALDDSSLLLIVKVIIRQYCVDKDGWNAEWNLPTEIMIQVNISL